MFGINYFIKITAESFYLRGTTLSATTSWSACLHHPVPGVSADHHPAGPLSPPRARPPSASASACKRAAFFSASLSTSSTSSSLACWRSANLLQ